MHQAWNANCLPEFQESKLGIYVQLHMPKEYHHYKYWVSFVKLMTFLLAHTVTPYTQCNVMKHSFGLKYPHISVSIACTLADFADLIDAQTNI